MNRFLLVLVGLALLSGCGKQPEQEFRDAAITSQRGSVGTVDVFTSDGKTHFVLPGEGRTFVGKVKIAVRTPRLARLLKPQPSGDVEVLKSVSLSEDQQVTTPHPGLLQEDLSPGVYWVELTYPKGGKVVTSSSRIEVK